MVKYCHNYEKLRWRLGTSSTCLKRRLKGRIVFQRVERASYKCAFVCYGGVLKEPQKIRGAGMGSWAHQLLGIPRALDCPQD